MSEFNDNGATRSESVRRRYAVLAIAASSGGPAALEHLLRGLGSDFPLPVLIVQHMMPAFTREFAAWLANAVPLPVELARNGQSIVGGTVHVAPENVHMKILDRSRLGLSSEPGTGYHRPSANVLFHSVAEFFADEALAVVLTGMGNDGVEGAVRIHENRGTVLVQDEASCVVFGMPGATIAAGAADEVVTLATMPTRIRRLVLEAHRRDGDVERSSQKFNSPGPSIRTAGTNQQLKPEK